MQHDHRPHAVDDFRHAPVVQPVGGVLRRVIGLVPVEGCVVTIMPT
ncbi:hypothetical protein [Polaromonas sp. YR568]|nr:hypothetical protein [Polaromonas sp. YR568]